jgi:hypothetical protein
LRMASSHRASAVPRELGRSSDCRHGLCVAEAPRSWPARRAPWTFRGGAIDRRPHPSPRVGDSMDARSV